MDIENIAISIQRDQKIWTTSPFLVSNQFLRPISFPILIPFRFLFSLGHPFCRLLFKSSSNSLLITYSRLCVCFRVCIMEWNEKKMLFLHWIVSMTNDAFLTASVVVLHLILFLFCFFRNDLYTHSVEVLFCFRLEFLINFILLRKKSLEPDAHCPNTDFDWKVSLFCTVNLFSKHELHYKLINNTEFIYICYNFLGINSGVLWIFSIISANKRSWKNFFLRNFFLELEICEFFIRLLTYFLNSLLFTCTILKNITLFNQPLSWHEIHVSLWPLSCESF